MAFGRDVILRLQFIGTWWSNIFFSPMSENGVHSGGINNGSVPLCLVSVLCLPLHGRDQWL
jgi:hypothetical protein